MLGNGLEFKGDSASLLKYRSINLVITEVKKSQANSVVEQAHQLVYNMIVTKDFSKQVFEYIYRWSKTI